MMKEIYILHDCLKDGDEFNSCFFNADDALKSARSDWSHLSSFDRARRASFFVDGFSVEISDDWSGTAEDLMRDLFEGDVVSDDFNLCDGSFKNQIFEFDFLASLRI